VSAAALLGAEHAAVREEQFRRSAQELVDLLRSRGVAFTASLARNETTDFREGLAWLETGGLLERRRAAGSNVLYVPTDKRANLDFYKNNIVHFFLVPALVARALVRGEDVEEYVRRWLRVLEWEFTLPDDTTIAEEIDRWRRYYRERGAVTGDRVRSDHPTLRATAGLLENFRESYLVATRTVAAVEDWPVARTGLFRAMRREYATGLLLGELRKPEGNSVVTFGNAVEWLVALGCLAPGVGKQARWLERGPRWDDLASHVAALEA
jgi:glycerol-3-phosphate O-acyltransferase